MRMINVKSIRMDQVELLRKAGYLVNIVGSNHIAIPHIKHTTNKTIPVERREANKRIAKAVVDMHRKSYIL